MKLHKAQKEIVQDQHRFRVVNAGRRFGKTAVAIEELFYSALTKKDANVAYVAPTYGQAREISWEMLKKRIVEVPNAEINESRLEIVIPVLNGKSKITLKGWESIESLRGQAFDFLVLDEVAMYRNFWLQWQEVLRPTLTDRIGRVLFISTPKGFNFWYDLYNFEVKDKDYKSFHFTSYDNPFLPFDELEKTKKELPEDRYAQEIMADFRKSEGLVYKEFIRAFHVFKDYPQKEWVEEFGGHDFGTTNPCASITIKKDRDAKYYVWNEFYKTGLTDAQQADYVAALKWSKCYPDPESASGILELKRRGVNVREVIKNKDSIRNGINTVKELFKTNRLKIHESCVNLIWELETYSYPERKPNHNEEENPIKENDHALDALRYALSMDNVLTTRKVYPVIPQAPRSRGNIAV